MMMTILDFFFTPASTTFDDLFRHDLSPIVLEKSVLIQRGIHHLDILIAAENYTTNLALHPAVKYWKYYGNTDLTHRFANRMIAALDTTIIPQNTIVCAVPLHWKRRLQRGFNQAEKLATIIAQSQNQQPRQFLKRTRDTGHQAWRKRHERLSALKDAFCCTGSDDIPDSILLIDDLATTCATLDASAEALKQAGVKKVFALTLAHGK